MKITYFDRVCQTEQKEQVYGGVFLDILYGKGWIKRVISFFLLPCVACISFSSYLYGVIQKSRYTRVKVRPFIKKFQIDTSEFLDRVDSFRSFNDFFVRKLKSTCRPIEASEKVVILPADARYLVVPNVKKADRFFVKGQSLSLNELLQDETLALRYEEGAMAIARLCPVDYHRFHFPCEGVAHQTREIPGPLFSVNPIALRRHLDILTRNKRVITLFESVHFGTIAYIEVGATYVGTIHQTFTPDRLYRKGEEKGYFSFGGSCVILLFEPGRIEFAPDLLKYSNQSLEVRGLMGQPLAFSL